MGYGIPPLKGGIHTHTKIEYLGEFGKPNFPLYFYNVSTLLKALFLYAVYSVVKTLSTAQELSMEITGLKPGISQGKIFLNLKMKISNRLAPVVFNSLYGNVYLNNQEVGLISYNNNDHIPVGVSEILIPVSFDPLLDTANIIQVISQEGFKNISVKGSVTIDNINLPYDNEIINSEPFKDLIHAAKL